MMKVLHHSEGLSSFEQFCQASPCAARVLQLWIELDDIDKIDCNVYLAKRVKTVFKRHIIAKEYASASERDTMTNIESMTDKPEELRTSVRALKEL